VRTVPYVFIDKEYVGGGTTVEKLHKDGLLKELLVPDSSAKSLSL